MATYDVTLEEDGDDLILPVPEDLMDELGWQEDDLLEWIIEDDHIVLRRVDEDELEDLGESTWGESTQEG
jgi:bifunctional DNA-binding transcriptional regulator/antitoxin component of YhaV-PrlF toxin-antitoxin module